MSDTIIQLELLCKQFFNEFNTLLDSNIYISKKDYQFLLDKYSIIFNNINDIKDNDIQKNIIGISNNIDITINDRNKEFIENKLIEYKSYFDNIFQDVDSNILLDEEQRKAILMDEDYSLVIAGAGSGKTTTMTAKAKYLIEKCNIKPEEIVVLSFTNKAIEELDTRINDDFKLGVNVKTFHKLGLEILKDRSGKLSLGVIQDGKKEKVLIDYFKEIIFPNKKKLLYVMNSFPRHLFLDSKCLEYNNFNDYWNYYTEKKYEEVKEKLSEFNNFEIENRLKDNRSIKNELLRSRAETLIANYLFTNGIDYKYESKYVEAEDKINYNPDFTIYLPNSKKIYIEYYGLSNFDQNGHYSKEEISEYNYLIRKKKTLHDKYGTDLIEIFPNQNFNSCLIKIKRELENRGVFFNQKTDKEIFLTIMNTKRNSQIFKFVNLIIDFISKFKGKSYTDKDFRMLVDKASEQKVNKQILINQLYIIREIYHYYNNYIHSRDLIDFEDMINYAYRYMENKPLKNTKLKYKYIIVDEYQDISYQRFNLLQKISQVFKAKIIGVGDDWQAIFGFSGADIELFTKFCELMGYGEIIKITNTYRNSQELIDIAGEFVLENNKQFNKHLTSHKHLTNPIEIIYYSRQNELALSQVLERIIEKQYLYNSNQTIALLGRYNDDINKVLINSNFTEGIKSENEIIYLKNRNIKLKFLTIHSSKGLGFDQVVLLNAIDDYWNGFPSKKKDEEIIAILNDKDDEEILYAEERRLFYVAITRTKNKVFILTPDHKASSFITEIRKYHNVLENKNYLEELEII